MKTLKLITACFIATLLYGSTIVPKSNLSCREIIDRMLDSVKKIKTQTFSLKSTERVNGHLAFAESFVKINVSPKKIYFRSSRKGFEILWVEGENGNQALVHSRSLPLVNFNLDPYGSVMRKDQHHTIFDLGSGYIGTTIENTILRAPKEFDKHFAYAGIVTFDNKECYQIVINYPEYKHIEYTTTKGETVTSLAKKFHTSDFKIRYKNNLSSYFGEITEGTKLSIPVPYSNKAILFVDKKTFVPLNIKVYDEGGLFESYEFYNMKTNIIFKSDEFLKSFKGYEF